MKTRMLGNIEVGEIGMGCMGFSHAHGDPIPRNEIIALMRKANDMGVTLYDTADVYGAGHNEILVGEALKPIRDKVTILTKLNPEVNSITIEGKGTPAEQIESRLDESLKRLDTDYVDIYMFHRVPQDVTLVECASAMADLIRKGKIRGWAMSRATAEQIREAQAICPLSVIQNEYSMMVRTPEQDGVLKACAEYGIGFTPYMPLAVGFLTGTIKPGQVYKNDDAKRTITWFTDENLKKNQPVLEMLESYSAKKNSTYAQIALAWLMHKYERLVPIPGMYQERFLYENLKTADVVLSEEEMKEIDGILDSITIYGDSDEQHIVDLRNMLKEEGYEIEKSWSTNKK